MLKKKGDWFTGTGVTFADLAVMVVLDFLQEPNCAGFKDMNNLEERKKVLDAFPLVRQTIRGLVHCHRWWPIRSRDLHLVDCKVESVSPVSFCFLFSQFVLIDNKSM